MRSMFSHRVMKITGLVALAALLAGLLPSADTAAQAQNLLANPGMEQPYDGDRNANGWGRWFEDTGKQSGTLDYAVSPTFSAEVNPVIVRSGSASQHIGNRYDPWHAGIKQLVSVPPNTPLRFCAFGRLFANNEDFEDASSVSSINGQMQVGIFPNGDAEWNTGGILWSAMANPHDAWQEICMEATSGEAGRVTVFVSSSYRGFSAYHLDAWWDDATLVVTAPPPTAAPTSPPPGQVSTPNTGLCQERPDGSVVYVVQSGDTLFGIALACDSTVDEIRQLNGLTSDLISIGQTLIVKGVPGQTLPTVAPPSTPQPAQATASPEATATPTETLEPTPVLTDGHICVEAFNDANNNQAKDSGEQLLGGVGFTLSDTAGVKGSYVTSGLELEAYCFGGLQPGTYTVDARPPLGVANTTSAEWPIGLTAGMKFEVQYGGSRSVSEANVSAEANPTVAEVGSETTGASSTSDGDAASGLGRIAMGVLGIIVLLGAGFMAGLVLMRARK